MRRRDRGQVILLFALALVALLGFAALAVDVGYMYSVRHELQRCADTGAHAGASAFIDNPPDANARARDYASRDAVGTSPLSATEVDVSFPAPDRVRVDTRRTVPLFFARVFGMNDITISASAVAEKAPPPDNTLRLVE